MTNSPEWLSELGTLFKNKDYADPKLDSIYDTLGKYQGQDIRARILSDIATVLSRYTSERLQKGALRKLDILMDEFAVKGKDLNVVAAGLTKVKAHIEREHQMPDLTTLDALVREELTRKIPFNITQYLEKRGVSTEMESSSNGEARDPNTRRTYVHELNVRRRSQEK